MNTLLHTVNDFWRYRHPRERIFLGVAGLMLALALVYALLIDPALTARQRLQRSLPALREQAGALRELLQEAKALPSMTVQSGAPLNRAAIEQSLKHKGIVASNIAVGDGTVALEFDALAFAGLVDWLNETQQTAHWQVESASVVSQPGTGMVKASVTLRQL